jgi:hypothetical protein
VVLPDNFILYFNGTYFISSTFACFAVLTNPAMGLADSSTHPRYHGTGAYGLVAATGKTGFSTLRGNATRVKTFTALSSCITVVSRMQSSSNA